MSQEPVKLDESLENSTKSQSLQTLTAGPLSSSLSNLSISSRAIPSNKDFHFFYNFDEFKLPIQEIAAKSQSLLESIGSSSNLLKGKLPFPSDLDVDEAYDWLVDVNDEFYQQCDMSLDEFEKVRKKEEETGRVMNVDTDSDFQLVYGNKKKKKEKGSGLASSSASGMVGDSGVKVAERKGVVGGKAKVPFHIPTIRRPQEEYNILVNNLNQPFEHVWLQRSEDGLRFIHPLEKLSVLDFVDKNVGDVEPASPLPMGSTPFNLVEEVKDLKEMAAKLRTENEIAVDLEHNQYRSFQGLTCLMQISTRTEDFVVDTLKLRIHIGPYLREIFKDPSKKKVMHGADRDILWLQKDFGIYVCNLFDTGQASRVLKLERNSLEYLLQHFCGITANKEYQNADWRLRPLPNEMIRYAREDTHYLLYIYDAMRVQLHLMPNDTENSDSPLVEVYKRSYDICLQLYEKDLLTESSYLHIYGLHGAGFNAQQLAVVAGLFEWRDVVARAEDESTGYILPNKTLLEIAKQMPVTTSKLHRLLKSKHPYVERNLSSVISIIRHAMQNSAAFESAAQQLKEKQIETASQENVQDNDESEILGSDSLRSLGAANAGTQIPHGSNKFHGILNTHQAASPQLEKESHRSSFVEPGRDGQRGSFKHHVENGEVKTESSSCVSQLRRGSLSGLHQSADMSPSAKDTGVTVQILKKPAGAFGALLGGAASKRKLDTDKKDKEEIKLERIRSLVNLPFHTFSGGNEPPKMVEEATTVSETMHQEESVVAPVASSNVEEVIMLDDDSDVEVLENLDSETTNACGNNNSAGSAVEMDKDDEAASLSDLSTSFQKCFESNNRNRKMKETEKSEEPTGLSHLKPFDYSAARKQVIFGEEPNRADGEKKNESKGRKKNSAGGRAQKDEDTREFAHGRRRQAFPASGNRSASFR